MSKPSLWMLDYTAAFSDEVMCRLVDAGIDSLWLFDQAELVGNQHPGPGRFDFHVTAPYVQRAKAAGFKTIRVQSPIGIPPWVPDSWALQNGLGDYSTLRGPFDDTLGINLTLEAPAHRSCSYWNTEAEDETHAYVVAMRKAVEPDAIVVGALANCGEYFFPSHFYARDHGKHPSAWYFDPYAQASYEKSGVSRDAWWRRERKEILLRRFSWYSERWTAFYEDHPRKSWARGTVDIAETLKTFDPRPNTIRFCGMLELTGTIEQGKHFPLYCGAEGCKHVLANTRKIIDNDLPIVGLLCGPLGAGLDGAFTDEAYKQLALAVQAR